MLPDDPRHGQSAGYNAGCRCADCWRAKQRYDKSRRWELQETGKYRKVSSVGTVRRIQALQRLGWAVPVMAKRLGLSHQALYDIGRYPTVYATTRDRIIALYDELSMVLPEPATTAEKVSVSRARNNATRKGWPPPLAWDDIDDENERPRVSAPRYAESNWEDSVDHAVVWRVVNGQPRPRRLSRAEAAEVVRILTSRGVSGGDMERLGFKPERYRKTGGENAA